MSSCIHDYQIITDSEHGLVEKCKLCRKRLVTRKGNKGRIDNKKYREEHRRDFLQPSGKTKGDFAKTYGEFDGVKVKKYE
jgi:hypothetical protein